MGPQSLLTIPLWEPQVTLESPKQASRGRKANREGQRPEPRVTLELREIRRMVRSVRCLRHQLIQAVPQERQGSPRPKVPHPRQSRVVSPARPEGRRASLVVKIRRPQASQGNRTILMGNPVNLER